MQSATLRGRRGIEYRRALPGRAVGWRLVLDKPSLLGVAGAYANLIEDPSSVAYGVLFDVSEDDLAHIELTEGVLIDNYHRVIVPVEPLASAGEAVHAFSLSSDRRDPDSKPTSRYMGLLIEGALEHRLPPKHIEFLRNIPTCEEPIESLEMRAAIDNFMRRESK
ncbi:MAG: gamma-glutamylcyclotransferase [Deltaproteobacteria bacterium]|nr:gamma-glutamylcyclotransferase [Deltaproteobacteria bacterium]